MAKKATLTEIDIGRALFVIKDKDEEILNRPFENGFNLSEILNEVAAHYLHRALEEANQSKTKAAKLVGLPNYQTFDNWLEKLQAR